MKIKQFWQTSAILTIGLPMAFTTAPSEAKILFSSNFDQGTKGFGVHADGCSRNKAFTTVSSPGRNGKALKITLKDCDKRGELYLA